MKKIIILLCIMFISLVYTDNYCIKDNYTSRKNAIDMKPNGYRKNGQLAVYEKALEIAISNNYNTIVDIGSGSGDKLINLFNNFYTIGFDLMPIINWVNNKYPNYDWRISDFTKPLDEKVDLIICSDVIEHLQDPNELLNWINSIEFNTLVISTPDRNLLSRGSQNGPPNNIHHIREWSFDEFEEYLKRWFVIEQHFHVDDVFPPVTPKKICQVVICKKP